MNILGIETSCDETGVAVYSSEQGLLAHALYSQVPVHAQYGGVVPELASRDHIRKLLPLTHQILDEAKLKAKDIDAVAYTAGPGLVGALMVGASFGRSLAWAWQVPAIGVHHMEAHLLAPFLDNPELKFPFVALLVSGGHTLLVEVKGIGDYRLLGESLDDAVGEAFDKTAKLLGLGYPGGPAVSKLAEHGRSGKFHFPRPMVNRPGLDFSFSGLKTFALNTIQQAGNDEQTKADIACAFQEAVAATMAIKCKRALEQTGMNVLVVAGGVSANTKLRAELNAMGKKQKAKIYFPCLAFCTDNGAMIAYAGYQRLLLGQQQGLQIQVHPRWSINVATTVTRSSDTLVKNQNSK